MDLTVHHLRCFLAVADELHFGRAAAYLHLSPSSLSEQISVLERRLSRPLFHRSSRRVELTEAGRQLLPVARQAVAAMDDVVAWAEDFGTATVLRVGLMVSSPGFRRVMAAAVQRMPRVQWQVRQLGFVGCYEALVRSEVDCAFVVEIGEAPKGDVETLPLWEEGCVAVVAEGHRLAERRSVTLAELAGERFVAVQDEATSSRWLKAVAAPGRSALKVLPVARGFEEVLELVGAGVGVNMAGSAAIESYGRPGLRFVPIGDAPTARTYLCLRPGHRPAALEEFARLAVATAHVPS